MDSEKREMIINGVAVNYEEFREKLEAARIHNEFEDDHEGSYGHAYNMGLHTMYYAALTLLLELNSERLRKGGKRIEEV